MRNGNNLDIKIQAMRENVNESEIAHYFGKSYSWLMQTLRFELSKDDKKKFFKAIKDIKNRHVNAEQNA